MGLIPNSKDPITAEWFNDCSEICGAGIVVEKDKTQITTELFEKLGKAIS